MVTKDESHVVLQGSTRIMNPGLTQSPYSIEVRNRATGTGHNWPPPRGSIGDEGGVFGSTHWSYSDDSRTVDVVRNSPTHYECRGRIFPWVKSATSASSFYPAMPAGSSQSELDAYGTHAIAQVIPTNRAADVAQFVGELREGLPKAVGLNTLKHRASITRSAGSEYLNIEFGWKPLISDLRKMYEANKKADVLLENLEAMSGKLVRRRYDRDPAVSSSTSTIESTQAYPTPTGPTGGSGIYGVPGIRTKTTTTSSRKWFSGAFTYHVDLSNSGWSREYQRLKYIYGMDVSPELLWNLTPWTWLAGWEFNTGDLVHNLSRFSQDGLVMAWGYVMEESIASTTYTLSGGRFYNGETTDCTQTFKTIRRSRSHATPFGFGLNPNGFTERQWSILAALGMTRAPKVLKNG